MNKDIFAGNWKQMIGEMQRRWGMLTNDELDRVDGSREKLEGLIQERYGKAREEVAAEIAEWESQYHTKNNAA